MKRWENNLVDRPKVARRNTELSIKMIPNDLIIEILSRLPAKSIAICRCVSKQWESLLRKPEFTESFMGFSLARPRILFTFKFGCKWHFLSSPQPQNLDAELSVVQADYHMGVTGYSGHENCLSVHGFVYLVDRHVFMGKVERIPVICNPFTGQHLDLPKVRARNINLRSFFGYDPIKKQFKVLCMTVTNYRKQVNSKEHQVLTVGLGKQSWRKLKSVSPHYPDHQSEGICINGVLYYIARFDKTHLVACFDVRSEKFSFIEMEEGSHITYFSALVNYKGNLGAVVYVYGSHREFWVLDKTEKVKWSKHILFFPNTIYEGVKSTWATDTGEIVWVLNQWTNPFYVFYYNFEKKRVRRVEIQGIEEKIMKGPYRFSPYFSVTNHVENVMFL